MPVLHCAEVALQNRPASPLKMHIAQAKGGRTCPAANLAHRA
jgi:hypothetical protein